MAIFTTVTSFTITSQVRCFGTSVPSGVTRVQVSSTPSTTVTQGNIVGSTASVVTTPARYSDLVNDLNSGQQVILTLTTAPTSPLQIIDFDSTRLTALAVKMPEPRTDPFALGEQLDDGSSSDSAIPI